MLQLRSNYQLGEHRAIVNLPQILGIVIAVLVVWSLRSLPREKWLYRLLHLACVSLCLLGTVGFFAPSFVEYMPSTFEWPVGATKEAIQGPGKNIAVLALSGARIQVYDANLRFLRGWRVVSHGGLAKLHLSETGKIEVFTARGDHHYLYDFKGELLEEKVYSGVAYRSLPSGPYREVSIPVTPVAYPLTTVWLSWLVYALGIGGFGLLEFLVKRDGMSPN